MNEKRRNSHYLIIGVISLSIIIILILIVVWFFMNGHETLISEDVNYGSITSLVCKTDHADENFFNPEGAQRYTHLITAAFKGDRLSNISYNFDGTYRSEGAAETDMARMHANYNKYMGSIGVYSESLNPIFNANKTKVRISLYAEPKTLSQAVMTLFFLEKDDYGKLKDLGGEDFEKMYRFKGFECTFRD